MTRLSKTIEEASSRREFFDHSLASHQSGVRTHRAVRPLVHNRAARLLRAHAERGGVARPHEAVDGGLGVAVALRDRGESCQLHERRVCERHAMLVVSKCKSRWRVREWKSVRCHIQRSSISTSLLVWPVYMLLGTCHIMVFRAPVSKFVTCQRRYRWRLEKNATQMAAISWRFTLHHEFVSPRCQPLKTIQALWSEKAGAD